MFFGCIADTGIGVCDSDQSVPNTGCVLGTVTVTVVDTVTVVVTVADNDVVTVADMQPLSWIL